jgi:hypothetical protein
MAAWRKCRPLKRRGTAPRIVPSATLRPTINSGLPGQTCIESKEERYSEAHFSSWASRHDATMQRLLRGMLAPTTPDVTAVLAPQDKAGELTFRLSEGVFVARRGGGS